MGLIDEIVKGYYAAAMQPVFEQMQNQFQEMNEYTQKVAQAQLIMEHEYELQQYRIKEQEEFEENLRCWFKRNIN